MPDAEELLAETLKWIKPDFLEVVVEQSRALVVRYRGHRITGVQRTADYGGSLRANADGRWSFVSFNDFANLPGLARLAARQAQLAGGGAEPFRPPQVNVGSAGAAPLFADSIAGELAGKLADDLAGKIHLLEEYGETIWQYPVHDVFQELTLRERTVSVASTAGASVRQAMQSATLKVEIFARRGQDIQQSFLSLGTRDWEGLKGRHGQVVDTARHALALLDAPALPGGEYTVVADPAMTGLFIHEALGHLLEADAQLREPELAQRLGPGQRIGPRDLTVIDSPGLADHHGSYAYDDEGVPAGQTCLVTGGIVTGRLHSLETAQAMGEAPTGNGRRLSFRHPPLVRMSNTYMLPAAGTRDDLIADIPSGVYVCKPTGGETDLNQFTFSANEVYRIENGRLAGLVRPVTLSGVPLDTLGSIDGVAGDLQWARTGGGCQKWGQRGLAVDYGGPHIRIQHCLVGGV